jgi:hypothetical protein
LKHTFIFIYKSVDKKRTKGYNADRTLEVLKMGELIAVIPQAVVFSAANLEKSGYAIIGMISIKDELHYVAKKEIMPKSKKRSLAPFSF